MLIHSLASSAGSRALVLTELVRGREGCLQAVVLNDRAAPLGVAHGAHVGHAQRVAALLPADVLQHKHTGSARRRHGDARRQQPTSSLFVLWETAAADVP